MKWFYMVSLIVVGLLAAAPFWLPLRASTFTDPAEVVLRDTYGAKVRSIDPATSGDNMSGAIQGHFYEGLYAYHFLRRPLELIPRLAAQMPQVSDDGLVYTIRIRDDARYRRNPCFGTDDKGAPLTRAATAEDFALAFKRIADFHIESTLAMPLVIERIESMAEYRELTRTFARGDFSRYDRPISGVKVLDAHTLQIRLTEPFPQLVNVLAMPNFAPIPREMIDYHLATRAEGDRGRVAIPMSRRDPHIRTIEAAVGTGPYYLSKFESGGDIEFCANEDFREEYYPSEGSDEDRAAGLLDDAGKRLPLIKVRRYTFSEEDYPSWMLFVSGQSDLATIPTEVFSRVIMPNLELSGDLRDRGVRLLTYTAPTVFWLAFNLEDPVIGRSKSLRQALQLSFNVEQYLHTLFNDRGIRAMTYIPEDQPEYALAHSPYARFDVEAAKAKLAQARVELGLQPGEPLPTLKLDLGGTDEFSRRQSEFTKQQFAAIGVNLEIELNDWPTLQQKVDRKQTQIFAMGWGADYPDPENFLQLYYTPNIARGTNHTNYQNPEFDRLYEQVRVMAASPQRTQLYVRMLSMLNEDCPNLLLSQPKAFVLSHPWVRNQKPSPYSHGNGRYANLDIAQRRQMLEGK